MKRRSFLLGDVTLPFVDLRAKDIKVIVNEPHMIGTMFSEGELRAAGNAALEHYLRNSPVEPK